jgi:hypothetical protein
MPGLVGEAFRGEGPQKRLKGRPHPFFGSIMSEQNAAEGPAETAAFEDLEQVHMAKDGLPMALWPKFPEGAITLWMAGDLIDAFPASIKEHCRAAELLGDGDLEAHRAYLNQFAREGYFEIFKDEMEWAYQREAARDYAASVVRDAPPRQGRRGDN